MKVKPAAHPDNQAASANITQRIQELGDWRGATLTHVRQLIHHADPEIEEESKWRGVPVWSHDGIVCTGESYKQMEGKRRDGGDVPYVFPPSICQPFNGLRPLFDRLRRSTRYRPVKWIPKSSPAKH